MSILASGMNCPIWGTVAQHLETRGDTYEVISDRAGGSFNITGSAMATAGAPDFPDWKRVAVSEQVFLANVQGIDILVNSTLLQNLRRASKLTVNEKIDRVLIAVSLSFPGVGEWFPVREMLTAGEGEYLAAAINASGAVPRDYAPELEYLLQMARREDLIEDDLGSPSVARIALRGWQRIEALGAAASTSDQIFVAMWFGGKHQPKLYDRGIRTAVESAGYNCLRIDDKHHNDKIDDQIIAEIRKSKAVIVDITCGLAKPVGGWSSSNEVGAPRGGVYFEAGFAVGLGKPVIWTVRDEVAGVENVVHFDVRQYNQIRWGDDYADFSDRLRLRIEATLGRGNARHG